MSDLGNLVRMLAIPKASIRFEAAELLRVAPAISDDPLAALERALRDPHPDVARSARSPLLVHAPHALPPPASVHRR